VRRCEEGRGEDPSEGKAILDIEYGARANCTATVHDHTLRHVRCKDEDDMARVSHKQDLFDMPQISVTRVLDDGCGGSRTYVVDSMGNQYDNFQGQLGSNQYK
jgi:hypothetical protein